MAAGLLAGVQIHLDDAAVVAIRRLASGDEPLWLVRRHSGCTIPHAHA